jgi:hypothetical protein
MDYECDNDNHDIGCQCPGVVPSRVGDSTDRTLLAQRLFVAMVEARNIDAEKLGEFTYEPIRPEHAWAELHAVAAEATRWA